MPDKEVKTILIFSLAYYPNFVGGAEVAIKEITDRISDIEWHILTLNFGGDPAEEKMGNVYVHRVGPPAGGGASYLSKILFVPRAARAARSLHSRLHFDALWAMMSYMLFPIVLARLSVPYVLTLQEGDPWEHMFSRWFILPFRSFLARGFRNASAVTALSTYLAEWARQMGYARPIKIVPNGVDIRHFSGTPVAHEGTVLITTSRLVHKNAIDDVIRALALLPPHIRFKILGTGPDEVALKELAKKEGVSERVEFLGHIDHRDMPRYLHAADIFIRPSRSEGQGASFMEAMATGLPVIATQEGGISDFLFDEKRNPDRETTGWAVDKDSPEQIAEAVKDIVANPEKVKKVTAHAAQMVREKYDWNLIAKQMRGVFDRLLKNR